MIGSFRIIGIVLNAGGAGALLRRAVIFFQAMLLAAAAGRLGCYRRSS